MWVPCVNASLHAVIDAETPQWKETSMYELVTDHYELLAMIYYTIGLGKFCVDVVNRIRRSRQTKAE